MPIAGGAARAHGRGGTKSLRSSGGWWQVVLLLVVTAPLSRRWCLDCGRPLGHRPANSGLLAGGTRTGKPGYRAARTRDGSCSAGSATSRICCCGQLMRPAPGTRWPSEHLTVTETRLRQAGPARNEITVPGRATAACHGSLARQHRDRTAPSSAVNRTEPRSPARARDWPVEGTKPRRRRRSVGRWGNPE